MTKPRRSIQKTRKIPKRFWISVLVAVVFLGLILLIVQYQSMQEKTASEQNFLDQFDDVIDVNSGISVWMTFPVETDPYFYGNIVVLNHTAESIIFKGYRYGFKIYCYDKINNRWKLQPTIYETSSETTTLPPRVETMDMSIPNILTIEIDELSQIECRNPRFFISGTGEKSGILYGAYIDNKIDPTFR